MSAEATTKSRPALRQVNLSSELVEIIDCIGLNYSAAIEEATGTSVELSRPQIILAIAKDALKRQDAAADAATNGSATGA